MRGGRILERCGERHFSVYLASIIRKVMSQLIRVRLLGTFAVFGADGALVDMPGKKIQALVGYLAAEYRRSHPREELATLLWGEALVDRYARLFL